MTTNTNEFRSMVTPVFVLFCGIALVFLAAMILRNPSRAAAEVMVLSSSRESPNGATDRPQINTTPSSTVSVSTELAAAEGRLVKNMEFFDSRFERFTADLKVAEEKALSRSDLVGTRYALKSLQDQLERLRGLTTEWGDVTSELLTDSTGQQIAADPGLMADFMRLTDRTRLSQRDVEELTERLEPLSDFIAMLEDQDKVPYEPGERFQTRLVSMNNNVTAALREYEESLAELRRLMRESRSIDANDETLQDAMYRWRRTQASSISKSTSTVPADGRPAQSEMPKKESQRSPTPPPHPKESSPERTIVVSQNVSREVAHQNPVVNRWSNPARVISDRTTVTNAKGNCSPSASVYRPASTAAQTRCRCGPQCPCRQNRHTVHHHVVCRH